MSNGLPQYPKNAAPIEQAKYSNNANLAKTLKRRPTRCLYGINLTILAFSIVQHIETI